MLKILFDKRTGKEEGRGRGASCAMVKRWILSQGLRRANKRFVSGKDHCRYGVKNELEGSKREAQSLFSSQLKESEGKIMKCCLYQDTAFVYLLRCPDCLLSLLSN